jgi:hypothetical protein
MSDSGVRRKFPWSTLLLVVLFYFIGIFNGCQIAWRDTPKKPVEVEVFEQEGSFNLAAGAEGQVNFPLPYKSPPNVTLDVSGFNKTIVSEATETGFKWKNLAKSGDSWNEGKTKWISKGVR